MFIFEMRHEVMTRLENNKEKETNTPEKEATSAEKVADNLVINKEFENLQGQCFDEIENVVFKLINKQAYKLTSIKIIFFYSLIKNLKLFFNNSKFCKVLTYTIIYS